MRTDFNTDSESSGRDIWMDLTDDGRLTGTALYSRSHRHLVRPTLESTSQSCNTIRSASCVCITTTVEPNSIKTSEFALAWHMPVVRFGLGQKLYPKFVCLGNVRFEVHVISVDGIQDGSIQRR